MRATHQHQILVEIFLEKVSLGEIPLGIFSFSLLINSMIPLRQLTIPPSAIRPLDRNTRPGAETPTRPLAPLIRELADPQQPGIPSSFQMDFHLPSIADLTRENRLSVESVELMPALWLQQTENRDTNPLGVMEERGMHGIPENRVFNGIERDPVVPPITLLSVAQSLGTDSFLQELTPKDFRGKIWRRLSPSFRTLAMSGVNRHMATTDSDAPIVTVNEDPRTKWRMLAETQGVEMVRYLALTMARYNTGVFDSRLADAATETNYPTTVYYKEGNEQSPMVRLEGRMYESKNNPFTFIPQLKRVTGFWESSITLGNNRTKNIYYDQSLIQSRILVVNVRRPRVWVSNPAYPLFLAMYKTIRRGKPGSKLFPDDPEDYRRTKHHVQFELYIRSERDVFAENGLPDMIRSPWKSEYTAKEEYPYKGLIRKLGEVITSFLQSFEKHGHQTDPDSMSDYQLYMQVTWIKNISSGLRPPIAQREIESYAAPQPSLSSQSRPRIRARPRPAVIQRVQGSALAGPSGIQQVEEALDAPLENEPEAPPPKRKRTTRRRTDRAAVDPTNIIRSSRRNTRATSSRSGLRSVPKRGAGAVLTTVQQRLFHRGSMLPRFKYERALFWCPPRASKMCILMSLMRTSQVAYLFENRQAVDIIPVATTYALGPLETFVPTVQTDYWRNLSVSQKEALPFLVDSGEEVFFRLFAGQKFRMRDNQLMEDSMEVVQEEEKDEEEEDIYLQSPHYRMEKPYYPGCRNTWEEDQWEQAAEELFAWMEVVLKRNLDQNDLHEMVQSFSDLFGVVICIYDVECRMRRIGVATPYEQSIHSLLSEEGESTLRVIHIVYDQGHIHPVSHFPSFIASKNLKGRDRHGLHHHYCPFCDERKKGENSSLGTLEKAKKHWTECARKRVEFTLREAGVVRERFYQEPSCVQKKFLPKETTPRFTCWSCQEEQKSEEDFLHHVCRLPVRPLHMHENDKIYVYDLETKQIPIVDSDLLEHVCNKMFVRKVYGEEGAPGTELKFNNEMEFLRHILTPAFEHSIFLAHNGGAFDVQFMLRVLERWGVDFHFIPSPNSAHKFLSIEIKEFHITFLDFMRFVPGSLRGIAKAFGCTLSKGDFPHKFNNGQNDSYIGPLPPHRPLEEDYWCQRFVKSESAEREFNEWYAEAETLYCTCSVGDPCQCGKKAWNFQEEIEKYCKLDVDVLAEIVRKYRDGILSMTSTEPCPDSRVDWRPVGMDPFSYTTIAQLALNMFSHGFQQPDERLATLHQTSRGGLNPKAIAWLQQRSQELGEHIYHRGNHHREFTHFATGWTFDGYCPATKTLFLFMDCTYWGCGVCFQGDPTDIHPTRKITYLQLQSQFEYMLTRLESTYKVEIMWEHRYDSTWNELSEYTKECVHLFDWNDAFYGGRTEVFSAYANADVLDKEIKDIDVTSLYPSVYLKKLCVGIPEHLLGEQIDVSRLHPTHSDRYFGFVKCHVTPRSSDIIGLLPQRDDENGRLCFPVYPMKGVWGTEELYFAMQHGYEVDQVYEVYHWNEEASSDQLLRGYVSFFLRMKQEAEGWKKLGASSDEPPPPEIMKQIIEKLYRENGGLARVRPEHVAKNPVFRQLAKLFLNSLWGKFAQKIMRTLFQTLYGMEEFYHVWTDPSMEQDSFQFRESSPGIFKAHYKIKEPFQKPVAHGNIFFAAMVTMHARCVLHECIYRIGPERALYVDTDSLKFLKDKDDPIENYTGIGLGKWTDEYPNETITEFAAMAPKMYSVKFASDNESVRGKGICLSLRNQRQLCMDNMKGLLLKAVQGSCSGEGELSLENMTIFGNCTNPDLAYGTMLTRENNKKVQVVISKRLLMQQEDFSFGTNGRITTRPFFENGN